jgi:maltoporin
MRHRWRITVQAICALLFFSSMAAPLFAQPVPDPPGTAAQPEPAPPPPDDLGFRFSGYLRSGYGIDSHGKGQQPFQAPLAGAKYRLGNEAETYLETAFLYGVHTEGDDPAYFDLRVRLAYVTPTSQTSNFATTFSLREAYGVSKRVWAAQPTATFWAGARFYDRQDAHINDFYYRDQSGFGGGVEDVALGGRAKLALAWIGGTQDELESNGVPANDRFRFNKNTLDLKAYDVAIGRTRASVAVDVSQFNGDEMARPQNIFLEDSVGASTTGMVEVPFTGGRNKTAVQYDSSRPDVRAGRARRRR